MEENAQVVALVTDAASSTGPPVEDSRLGVAVNEEIAGGGGGAGAASVTRIGVALNVLLASLADIEKV
jgi:hypothetical protein